MAGMGLFLGSGVSPVQMLVQGSGSATRMKATSFRNEIKRSPALQLGLSHYLYAFMAQVAQTAACNRHHQLGQRLARWLLMTQDRLQSNEFRLTQEFLAHMLGVRRVGVTRAAGLLQEKKLISYRRGNIAILDRKGLERASCRCYRDVNNLRDRMLD
jgi:CRP-like cAMP-binding protein